MFSGIARIYQFVKGLITGTSHLLNPQRHLSMRFVYPLLLCLLTYNPLRYSYIHFVWEHTATAQTYWPLTTIAGLILIAAWLIFYNAVRAAFSSKLLFGLVAGVFCLISYVPFFFYWVNVTPDAITWATIFVISGTFWSGSILPIMKARFFSQVQVTGQVRTHEHMVDQPSHHHDTNADDADGSDLPTTGHHHH